MGFYLQRDISIDEKQEETKENDENEEELGEKKEHENEERRRINDLATTAKIPSRRDTNASRWNTQRQCIHGWSL